MPFIKAARRARLHPGGVVNIVTEIGAVSEVFEAAGDNKGWCKTVDELVYLGFPEQCAVSCYKVHRLRIGPTITAFLHKGLG